MFEIIFKYYKHKENLEYDKEESHILKKKFGQIDEEYPVDKIACYIMSQLARRDIFIHDVEVYEFTKKKLNFKVNKNGFSIGKHKFGNDDAVQEFNLLEVKEENCCGNKVSAQCGVTNVTPPPSVPRVEQKVNNKKILRHVSFLPPLQMDKSKFPYKFTLNKRYPVYSEKYSPTGIGMIINTLDDNGNSVDVTDEYFIPANISLEHEGEMDAQKKNNNDLLNWKGDRATGPMINLRGK